MLTKLLAVVLLPALPCVNAQNPILVGGGYEPSSVLNVAPGQVLTLFATGIGKALSDRPIQSSAPFPATVAGISVTITPGSGGAPLSAPIIAAMLIDTCQSVRRSPCTGAKIAAITVQVPFELPAADPTAANDTPEALLRIIEDGASSTELLVKVFESRVHFIAGRHALALDTVDGMSQGASVFHAGGTPVAAGLPARMGETLVVYGYGFGRPDRPLRTGEAAPEANSVPMRGNVQFSVLPPEQPQLSGAADYPLSRYISYFGVAPGTVGVYQMNFVVPRLGQGIRRCDASTPTNFTVTYIERSVASNFAFCVEQ